MCENCFDNEIYKFESESEFLEFEKKFNLKEKFFKIANSKHEFLNDYHYIYICENCYENWWLSIPDNAWRGYFLTKNNAESHIKEIKSSEKAKRNGCFLLLVFIIFIIITIYNMK